MVAGSSCIGNVILLPKNVLGPVFRVNLEPKAHPLAGFLRFISLNYSFQECYENSFSPIYINIAI